MNNPLKELSQLHEELDDDPQPQEQTKDSSTTSHDESPAGCGPSLDPVAWMGVYNEHDLRDMYTVVMRHKTDFSDKPSRLTPLVDGNKAADTIAALTKRNDEQAGIIRGDLEQLAALMKERDEAQESARDLCRILNEELGGRTFMGEPLTERSYWCVVCRRRISSDKYGVFMHDDIPHPFSMAFDDDKTKN